jgi:hypothetical protein
LGVNGKFFDELTGTVSGAVVGAGGSSASLSFITFETLAFTGLSVTDTLVGAFSVVMGLRVKGGGINPGEFKGALSFGTVSTDPVLVARTFVVFTTRTVSRASIGTSGSNGDDTE